MNRIRILDFLTGKKVWRNYKLLDKTQWYSQDEMREFQLTKLKKLLSHCYDNVPYYTKIINERKINIKDADSIDVLKKFPILTKDIIKDNYQDFIPINNKKIKGVKSALTGGTTGNTLLKRNDANVRSVIWGSFYRFEKWMGLKDSDKRLILKAGHPIGKSLKRKISGFIVDKLENSITVDIYDTSEDNFDRIISLLQKNNFTFIRSYPNFLFNLARYIEKKGLKFNIKAISTTAEPLLEDHRQLFKRVFNAEIYDQYGCGEIGALAYECDKHNGLHITEERVIFEMNDNNQIIITDLDNYTLPFIRYWNADEIIINKDEICSCGRKSKLIKGIKGRTCDYVIGINNTHIPWAFFWILFYEGGVFENINLEKFQIVQESKEKIIVYLVCKKLSEKDELFLIEKIKNKLGNIEVEIKYKEDIANTKSGKYRPVINKLL